MHGRFSLHNPEATNDDGSCAYPEDYVDCDGICLNDADGDGVCDELKLKGVQRRPLAITVPWRPMTTGAVISVLAPMMKFYRTA